MFFSLPVLFIQTASQSLVADKERCHRALLPENTSYHVCTPKLRAIKEILFLRAFVQLPVPSRFLDSQQVSHLVSRLPRVRGYKPVNIGCFVIGIPCFCASVANGPTFAPTQFHEPRYLVSWLSTAKSKLSAGELRSVHRLYVCSTPLEF